MKLYSPAADRNKEAIHSVLGRLLPEQGLVLEVASGSGQHAVYFAEAFPALDWQPTDGDFEALESIASWVEEAGRTNLRPPYHFDVLGDALPVTRADALICCNMIHISPSTTTEALFEKAARLLPSGAPLLLYGPFIESDRPTAASNLEFDRSLRSRDPSWGVRRLDDVAATAARHGFVLEERVDMPANNLTLVFRRMMKTEKV